MSRRILFYLVFILMSAVNGCSQGAAVGSVMPLTGSTHSAETGSRSSSSHGLLGYWQCELDISGCDIHIIPARSSMLHINAVGSLNYTMGLGVSIDKPASDPPNGYFVLDVSITHPFPSAARLAGFDVRGILITTAGQVSGDFLLPGPDDPELSNADGFTRWWNPVEFSTPGLLGYKPGLLGINPPDTNPLCSMINPYKLFADGLGPEDDIVDLALIPLDDDNGRCVFKSGSVNTRRYKINFPAGAGGPKVWFNYAVDASWLPPLVEPPEIPDNFPPDANSLEAWMIQPSVVSDTLWIDQDGNCGGTIDLKLTIRDWQGMIDGYDGEVGPVTLVSPQIDFGSAVAPDVVVNGDGSATLEISMDGEPLIAGPVDIWVGIESPGSVYKQGLPDAPPGPVSAYSNFSLDVDYFDCADPSAPDCSEAWQMDMVSMVQGLVCPLASYNAWYVVPLTVGKPVDGTITLENFGYGNLDLRVYEGCGYPVLESSENGGTNDEQVVIKGTHADNIYIEVYSPLPLETTPLPFALYTDLYYDLIPCTDDDNNNFDTAQPVSLSEEIPLTVCPSSDIDDWFSFIVHPGLYASGSIALLNNGYADNDIYLIASDGMEVLASGEKIGTVDEIITVSHLPEGIYLIKVHASENYPDSDRPCTLVMGLTEGEDGCYDDDGNNTPENATPVGLVSESFGTVCEPSDTDWYSFEVGPEMAAGVITLSSPGMYDNDLYVYKNPYSGPVFYSAQHNYEIEIVETGSLSEGTWYIKVRASQATFGNNQPYTLTLDLDAASFGPMDFFIHALIVRQSDGTNPAVGDWRVYEDAVWASEFFEMWLGWSVSVSGITYVDNTAWLSLTKDEGLELFDMYKTGNGELHVVYANDIPDMPGAAAYAWMSCTYDLQTHDNGFVVMSSFGGNPVFSHEMGHALGLLLDTYNPDMLPCSDRIQYYCGPGTWDVFCSDADGVPGNLMWYTPGGNPSDYFISNEDVDMVTPEIDSQAENFVYFHTYYPDNYHKP